MHKERIPLHKESGFLCRKRKGRQRPGYVKNTSGPGRVRKGMKEARASRRSNGARAARGGKHSPAYHNMSRGGCQGEYTPGGYLGVGEDRGGASGASAAAAATGHASEASTAGHAWGNERK